MVSMKVNMNRTKVMTSGESRNGVQYTILQDGHVVFVVEVLVETQYIVLNVRSWTASVMV